VRNVLQEFKQLMLDSCMTWFIFARALQLAPLLRVLTLKGGHMVSNWSFMSLSHLVNLEEMHLTVTDATRLIEVPEFRCLSYLHIVGEFVVVGQVPGIDGDSNYWFSIFQNASLKKLVLSGPITIRHTSPWKGASLRSLELHEWCWVDASNADLSEEDMALEASTAALLVAAKNLQDLKATVVSAFDLEVVGRASTTLTELHLTMQPINELMPGNYHLSVLSALTNLTELSIPFGAPSLSQQLWPLSHFLDLQRLRISGEFSAEHVSVIQHLLSSCTNLTEIVSRNGTLSPPLI
jgi:hypothetical protein